MINPNLSHHLQPVSDNYWTVDFIKAIVEHPGYIPSHVFANVNFDSSMENDFKLKFLQDIYNPPDNQLNLSQTKQLELHSMRLKNRYQPTPLTRDGPKKPDLQWNNNQEDNMIRIMNRNYPNVSNKPIQRGYPSTINPFVPIMAKNRAGFYNRPDLTYNQKRKMDMNVMFDMSKKFLRSTRNSQTKNVPKGPNFIDLVDEELEPSLPERRNKRENKLPRPRHLARTGLNKRTSSNPIEILDSPDLDEAINQTVPPINCELARSEEPSHFEEEKAELTTSTLNLPAMEEQTEQEGDITNENSKAETFEDAFDFNIDDLGIKILGEVFLCNRCQKQISQKDADKGFKETCPSCSKAISRSSKKTQQAAAPAEPSTRSKQVQAATSTQSSKDKTKDVKEVKEPIKEPLKEMEKYWVLAPLYQNRSFYEETSLTNILDPQQRQKNTPVGRNNQIGYMPLTLYNTSSGRKTRKLWKPDRLDAMICKLCLDCISYFWKDEKFKDEVNAKNGVHLIDEEVTEILVRHRYNVESALEWSARSNPEFQYYLKRSANRKRLITRGTGKNY